MKVLLITDINTKGNTLGASPSKTFLFDNGCSGRSKYTGGNLKTPQLVWSFRLRSYPQFAPESTPAFDDSGNLYFGAHDGCFYSLTLDGKLRWVFKTGSKIYSSPAISNESRVYAGSGDGFLYCFDTDGQFRWAYHISQLEKPKGKLNRKLQDLRIWRKMYDLDRKKVRHCKVWSSPKITHDHCILINGLGKGLHAVDAETGNLRWCFPLGGIQYNRAGAALGPDNKIYIPSHRRFLHCLSPLGSTCWTYDSGFDYDTWGTPSVDTDVPTVYFPLASRENKGAVVALDPNGGLRWRRRFPGALRGSVSIGYDTYVVVCGFDGVVYFLAKNDGRIVHSQKLTRSERGLWTTASIDPDGSIFLTTKDSRTSGSIYRIGQNGDIQWQYKTGKALSTPVLDADARLYAGTWSGQFLCIQT